MKIKLAPPFHILFLSWCVLTQSATFAEERDPKPVLFEFAGAASVIPITEGSVHPITLVGIGNDAAYKFVVDTGASVNVLDSAIAKAKGYAVVGKTSISAPGGDAVSVDIVAVPLLKIGGGVIKNAEFVTMDIDGMTSGLMQGVIGMHVFKEVLLTFDQQRNQIRVARETLSADSNGVLPYRDIDGHIQIDIDVAGTTVATHVDTGSMASFTLPVELKETLPLQSESKFRSGARLVGGSRSVQHAQLDGDIVLAGNRYANPRVGFMNPSPGYGNVGSGVLRDFVLSIDQKNHLIRFQKNKDTKTRDRSPRRLGVEFRGAPGGRELTVGRIETNSIGEKYGLLPGDILVAVNGRPTGEYGMQGLGKLIRGSEPLTLEIQRDGSPQKIEIP